jgi:GTP cyclohydrolase IA
MALPNPEEAVKSILQHLGENPDREGLIETPLRVVKSWKELYAGYGIDPASIFTTFKEVEGYQQIVICKNIEIYSMCEHHMLPFYGRAHVAYLPNDKVVGISKLARLVDIFARRLQIQERLGEQVTKTIMEELKPLGAACIIEASHMCMRMRGCNKQESTMMTSSLKGVFLKDLSARQELLQLISL